MMRKIHRRIALSDKYIETLDGTFLDEHHYSDLIGGEDVDVLKPDGSPLLSFRSQCKDVPSVVCTDAFGPLKRAAKFSGHRGGMESGTVGFFDRGNGPGATAFTRDHPKWYAKFQPYLRCLNRVSRRTLPDQHARQQAIVDQTDQRWIIPGTIFTTVTVNRTEPFPAHRDKGNLAGSYAVMSVIDAGEYDGCYLCFPKYQIAVDLRCRDVLIADVNEYHGSTPFQGEQGRYERISVVCYYYGRLRSD